MTFVIYTGAQGGAYLLARYRHIVALRLSSAQGAAWTQERLSTLPDYEFVLPGEIVADCAVTMQRKEQDINGNAMILCTVELLTILSD